MVYAKIAEENQAGKIVAEMPLFIWRLTGWLCKHEGPVGTLGGVIINSYRWDYGTGRHWLASLVSGVRTWWGCRACW